MSIGNVLVIRPGALGDSVLTLPALAALHRAGAESLTVLGTPASFGFFNGRTAPVRIADFSSSGWLGLFADGASLSETATAVLKRTQTAIVYLGGDTRKIAQRLSAFGVEETLLIEPPKASGGDAMSTLDSNTFTEFKWEDIAPNHAARQLLDPLATIVSPALLSQALDPATIEQLGWLAPNESEIEAANRTIASQHGDERNFVAIHPGSGGRKKCWPAERFAQLAARIARETPWKPLVFFGPADDRTRAEFEAAMPTDVAWRAIAHRPLREVLALLHSCRCFVGNDSGMAHFAARATAVFAIFGPTEPQGWAPIGRRTNILAAARGDLKMLYVDDVLERISVGTASRFRARQAVCEASDLERYPKGITLEVRNEADGLSRRNMDAGPTEIRS